MKDCRACPQQATLGLSSSASRVQHSLDRQLTPGDGEAQSTSSCLASQFSAKKSKHETLKAIIITMARGWAGAGYVSEANEETGFPWLASFLRTVHRGKLGWNIIPAPLNAKLGASHTMQLHLWEATEILGDRRNSKGCSVGLGSRVRAGQATGMERTWQRNSWGLCKACFKHHHSNVFLEAALLMAWSLTSCCWEVMMSPVCITVVTKSWLIHREKG